MSTTTAKLKSLTFSFLAITALASAQELDVTALEKPVPANSLAPEKLAAFKKPVVAAVTTELISKRVGPMSFTSGTQNDLNYLNTHGGFEPMAWRPMLRPAKDSAKGSNVIVFGNFVNNLCPAGLLDGARVRVYQAANGKLELVRDARVKPGGHRGGGWKAVPYGWIHCAPGQTTFDVVFDANARLNAPYWFMVRAVYAGGSSADSAPVKVTPTTMTTTVRKPEPYQRNWNSRLKPAKDGVTRPEPPRNMRVEFKEGVAQLSWEPVAPEGLLGYSINYSNADPSTFEESSLELDGRGPRPDRTVQANDLVFIDHLTTTVRKALFVDAFFWNEVGYWPEGGLSGLTFWPDEDPKKSWRLAPHPQPLPREMTGAGETCLEIRTATGEPVGVELIRLGGSKQGFYRVLAARPHTFEAWVRGEGKLQLQFAGPYAPDRAEFPYPIFSKKPAGPFPMPAMPVPLDKEWKKVKVEFTPPGVPEDGHGAVYLTFTGPGTLYLDNVIIYENDRPRADFAPLSLRELERSGMTFMRTHELIKTKYGYTLNGMTNPAGGNNYMGRGFRIHTFHTLLRQMKLAKTISPWLQIEMCLDENEWLGFAEWFCAPYDPQKDTPQSKPWAYKRWSMGQEKPWIDEFPRFAFEISNETWNGIFAPYNFHGGLRDAVTGRQYQGGEEYGLLNEHVIQTLRRSPYWKKEHEAKTTHIICGWAVSPYGVLAKRHSPSADIITSAAYCANDGLGDPKVFTDFKMFYQLQWTLSAVAPQTERELQNQRELLREGLPVEWGMYEFGPNYYVMPGDPPAAKEVDQRLARNLTGAVYVLDSVLHRARAGYTEQAFFTFEHQIGCWGTHTLLRYGGHSYPKWKAMTLYNHFGTGRYLRCDLQDMPTWDFPEYVATDNFARVKRRALPQAPLVSVYAALDGDRLTVFLLSRKLDNFPIAGDDGFTPVTIKLPFAQAKKTTLHRLVGDPRVDDRFKEHARIETVDLGTGRGGQLIVNEQTGGDRRGLPPASVFCYVFEGVSPGALNEQPLALIGAMPTLPVNEPVPLANQSKDVEDGQPACQWQIEGVGEFKEFAPKVTFPKLGYYDLELAVTDKRGATDRDRYRVQVVQPDAQQRGWTVWAPGSKNTMELAFPAGGAELRGAGFGGQAVMMDGLLGNCEFAAVLEKPQTTNAKAVPSAGFSLLNQSAWSTSWTPQGIDGLWVGADGAVRNGRRQELLPSGSVSFPAEVKIAVTGGTVRFAVKQAGQWRELIVTENAVGPYYPALGVHAGGAAPATARFTALRFDKQ